MSNKINMLPMLWRLEYLLPLIYILIAGIIFCYQIVIPNTNPPSMIGFNFRTTDWILAILNVPSLIIFSFFSDNKSLHDSSIMLWYTGDRNVRYSITSLFIITPISYFLWGLLIRKGIELYWKKNSGKKS